MKSVDKLRTAAQLLEITDMRPSLYEIADEIEAEIQRDYMRLPVDMNGEAIRLGDMLEQGGKEIGSVTAIVFDGEPRVWALPSGKNISTAYCAKHVTHYHAPTVEDVLYTYGQSCIRAHEEAISDDAKREMLASLRKEFEMKLREVLANG